MRERLVSLLLALASLAAFYALILRPTSLDDRDAHEARPVTSERRGNGYAGLYEWLARTQVRTRSLRERYTALPELGLTPRGNLLVLTLPSLDNFRHAEYAALDRWVRQGNTLMVLAALVDQPDWSAQRATGTVAQIESLTGLEFENARRRAERLDDTPLAEQVRAADEREARAEAGEDVAEESEEEYAADAELAEPAGELLDEPQSLVLSPTGPHPLLQDVSELTLETDYPAMDWALRVPYDGFALTLARTAAGEGALFEQRLGAGRLILSAGGSLFTNRALGKTGNAQLFANIVRYRVGPGGTVLFDDLRQGVSASYDPVRFYRDPRLYQTLLILVGLWLVWVVGSTRLRAPIHAEFAPSEADLIRHSGGLIARTVPSHDTARRLFDGFFLRVGRAVRGATGEAGSERGELWQWLENHAALLPQEIDQLKEWYARAYAERKVPLVQLQNLLDTVAKRL